VEISGRKLAILKAIIDDYIVTGIPVGSRTISKKPGMELSSATIRNEMSDLEELGFLEQPHTSAGRIPSDTAYRLYVDRLMRVAQLNPEEAGKIKEYFNLRMNEIQEVIEKTAQVLSETTEQISMVLTPQLETIELRRIQLVKIMENKALILIVTNSGLIKETIIHIPTDIGSDYLDMISNMLTEKAYNKTLQQTDLTCIREVQSQIESHTKFLNGTLEAIKKSVMPQTGKSVVLGGAKNIFNFPEYQDVEKAKNFLQVLETREMLYDMLTKATKLEFSINIGRENEFDQVKDMSVVTATYKIGGKAIGSFGVIGPTRMDYSKVLSILNHVGGSLNSILSNFLDNDTDQ
jgi:heat-inducible transcriptional repressor